MWVMALQCTVCSVELDSAKALDFPGVGKLCGSCFVDRAGTPKKIKKEDLDRLKREVEGETAGLLPQETLLQIIEEGYDRLVKESGSFDDEVTRMAIEVQRLSGLAVAKKVMEVLGALGKLVEEQEEEVRRVLRKLGRMGG